MHAEPDQPFTDLDPATLAVRDLMASSRERVGRMAQRMGMNSTDMSAVGALVQHGPMGVTELADHLGIRSASATLMVDRLERAGQVRRERGTADRRRVVVTTTDAARTTSTDAWLPLVRAIDDVSASLSTTERAVVLRYFERIAEAVAGVDRPR